MINREEAHKLIDEEVNLDYRRFHAIHDIIEQIYNGQGKCFDCESFRAEHNGMCNVNRCTRNMIDVVSVNDFCSKYERKK